SADTIRHHAPWPTRPAGASGSLRDISLYPCDLDFGRPAAARSRRRVDPHHSPWHAGAAFDATARYAGLLCLPRTHFADFAPAFVRDNHAVSWTAGDDTGRLHCSRAHPRGHGSAVDCGPRRTCFPTFRHDATLAD